MLTRSNSYLLNNENYAAYKDIEGATFYIMVNNVMVPVDVTSFFVDHDMEDLFEITYEDEEEVVSEGELVSGEYAEFISRCVDYMIYWNTIQ